MENNRAEKPSRRRKRPESSVDKLVADAFNLDIPTAPRPKLRFLDEMSIALLREKTFALLEEYGVAVIHEYAYSALLKAGAKQSSTPDRLRLPRELVKEALAQTPKETTLCGLSEKFDMHLPREDGGFIMRTGTGGHGYVDPRDDSYRKLDLQAVDDIAAVASGLDNIGFIAHPFVHGVPEVTSDIHSYGRLRARTNKHCWMQPYQKENTEYLMKIAAIAAGGEAELRARPNSSVITTSFTPLEFKYMDTEVIVQAGKFGIPIHACSLPSGGGTAPLSAAGMVLMGAAEILGMMTMANIVSPGTPVIATPLMFTLDMRTGSALQSCVESQQAASMAVQLMGEGFGMMTHTYGAGSDTPDADHQSMAERTMLAETIALSGADILGGVGQLETATVFSPVQAVLDNEIGSMLRRFIRAPEVCDAAFNWDEVSNIRIGGHFLDSPHTISVCRDQVIPDVFLRDDRGDYEKSGRRTAFDAAREKALLLIKRAPEEGMLSEDQNVEITKLQRHADKHIVAAYSGKVDVI